MRLYSRTGATAVDHPEHGHFEAADDGGFDFPDELSDALHRYHVHGRPAWETAIERQNRLIDEELERRKDPATLLSAVEQLVAAASAVKPAAVVKAEPEPDEGDEESDDDGADEPAKSTRRAPAKRAGRTAK
jgi:hypothetical protein